MELGDRSCPGCLQWCPPMTGDPVSMALWPSKLPAWRCRPGRGGGCLVLSAYQATAAALRPNSTIPVLVQTIVAQPALQAHRRAGSASRWTASRPARLALPLPQCPPCRRGAEFLLQHYLRNPVAIGYRQLAQTSGCSWCRCGDANHSRSANLIRTTLYVSARALAPHPGTLPSLLFRKSRNQFCFAPPATACSFKQPLTS